MLLRHSIHRTNKTFVSKVEYLTFNLNMVSNIWSIYGLISLLTDGVKPI